MKDKISVIIPCYNVEKYIMRCFQSIYTQTYGFENLEVIFIDDLSTDHTYTIIESLQKRYPQNVIAVSLQKKGMAGGARNVGLDIASGAYITFVDADDCIHPEMLEQFWEKMKENNFDVIQCQVRQFCTEIPQYENENNSEMEILDLNDIENQKKLIIRCTGESNMSVWAKMYTTKFLKENGIRFVEKIYFEDDPFTVLCILLAKKYGVIKRQLLYHYFNQEGIIHSSPSIEKIRDLSKAMDSMLEEIKRRGIGEACHREIQILVVWKSYFYALNLLDRTLEIERNFYIDHIADLFEKKEILQNPYLSNIQDQGLLEKMEYLKCGEE